MNIKNDEDALAFIKANNLLPVVSMSGGKDSLAVALHMRDLGLDCRHVFADTGWESKDTYEYLETLKEYGFDIDVVKSDQGGFRDIAKRKAGAPMRRGRWCTDFLKLRPIARHYRKLEESTGRDIVSIVGIRAEEGAERAKMPYFEDDAGRTLDTYVWRPIMSWSVERVLDSHHRHGVPVNPLYKRGHNRVGCYPCILANKEEIRLVSENDPERIEEIHQMELEWERERIARNEEKPGRYKTTNPTFFQRSKHIKEMEAWSKTKRGGKSLLPVLTEPDGGCFRWGLCEPPI